ncbi:MAG: MarR family transcriptional regulator [Gammaproteobacteria bacterium]|nr:MarR family transcriptional regulator [Gammaproteobacteria bacterium]
MENIQHSSLLQVVLNTQQLAIKLSAIYSSFYRKHGINAGQKSLMDVLADNGPLTVPQLATHKQVSRQHIQSIVNHLKDKYLVELVENPAHKRSVIIQLSKQAEQQLKQIKVVEDRLHTVIADRFLQEDLELTARTLRGLTMVLATTEFQNFLDGS